MYRRDDLYRALLGQAAKAPFDGQQILIQRDPLSHLALVDEEIILADPYAINHGLKVKARGIAAGRYPVWLLSKLDPLHRDRIHLGLYLSFQEDEEAWKDPTHFRMILPDGFEEEDLDEGAFYGLATESGNISLMASQTCQWLLEHPEDAGKVLSAIEEDIAASFFEIGGAANIRLPKMEANVVTAVVRGEPGVYPAFWVLDEKEDLRGLLLDFTAPNPLA